MNFFDYIKNDGFFKPLTFKYKRIYYDCIQILIDKMKELPVLYESDAKDSITIYLKNMNIDETSDVASDEEDSSTDLQAADIISLFRECGWLLPREIGRNGEYVVNVSVDCRRIMDFLRKMSEKAASGTMSNRIFSMYEIMKSAFEENSVRRERPYTNILVPLMDNESELKNELTDLKDSISSIMKSVIEFQDMNSFGQFIMKDEMLDRFFSEYFFVKNNGLIPAQIAFIKSKLRILRQDEDTIDKMVDECMEKLMMSYDESKQRIERYFSELQYFLSEEYSANMELIDNRINTYYNLANTRIMLMSSNGVRLEVLINDFLNALSKLDENKQNEAMEKVADCICITNQKYVSGKSFEKIKRNKNAGDNIGLKIVDLSQEEIQQRTQSLFNQAINSYSMDKVSQFLNLQLGNESQMNLKEKNIETKEEILMYAAAMLYAKNEEFPYDIQLSQEIIQTDIADISNLTIIKK